MTELDCQNKQEAMPEAFRRQIVNKNDEYKSYF